MKRKNCLWPIQMIPVLALFLCEGNLATAGTHAVPSAKHTCCQESRNAAPLSDSSVYQLTSDWTTDTRQIIKLGSLRGRPQVVALIFTSCQGACPLLVHQIQQLEQTLPSNVLTNIGFLLVTFDTDRDTPEVLHAYRNNRNLSGDQWTLLTGRSEDIQELALVLGVKYRKEASGQFSHSNLITILNAGGEISYQQTGLENSGNELTKHLAQLFKSRTCLR